jgi:hypothetical protein
VEKRIKINMHLESDNNAINKGTAQANATINLLSCLHYKLKFL